MKFFVGEKEDIEFNVVGEGEASEGSGGRGDVVTGTGMG